jgi:hypothetical protein
MSSLIANQEKVFSHNSVFVFAFTPLQQQDKKLKQLVSARKKNGKKPNATALQATDWEKIASNFGPAAIGRNANQCKERYNHLHSSQMGKGPWSTQEDKKIISMVTMYGASLLLIITTVVKLERSRSYSYLLFLSLFTFCRTQKVEPDCGAATGKNRQAMSRKMAQSPESGYQ